MKKLKDLITRSIGVILFAFIPGMASGSLTHIGWFLGGLNGVATVFSSIIIYFGIQLAWDANVSDADIEKGFRAAVAKQAENNPEVKTALDLTTGTDVAPSEPVVEAPVVEAPKTDFTYTAPATPAAPEAPATGLAADPFG